MIDGHTLVNLHFNSVIQSDFHTKCSNFATIWSLSDRRNIGRTTKSIVSTFPIVLRA